MEIRTVTVQFSDPSIQPAYEALVAHCLEMNREHPNLAIGCYAAHRDALAAMQEQGREQEAA